MIEFSWMHQTTREEAFPGRLLVWLDFHGCTRQPERKLSQEDICMIELANILEWVTTSRLQSSERKQSQWANQFDHPETSLRCEVSTCNEDRGRSPRASIHVHKVSNLFRHTISMLLTNQISWYVMWFGCGASVLGFIQLDRRLGYGSEMYPRRFHWANSLP